MRSWTKQGAVRHVVLGTAAVIGASLLATGCAKRPTTGALVPAAEVKSSAVSPSGGPSEASIEESGFGRSSDGPAWPRPAASPLDQVAGTTLPALPSPDEFREEPALHEIRFDYDRYAIRSADAKILEENARWLLANPGARLLIEGHCDERGTEEYNLSLGERRARAARDYLAKLGVNGERVVMLSYGKERPACRESSEGCWARNRRARFLVAS